MVGVVARHLGTGKQAVFLAAQTWGVPLSRMAQRLLRENLDLVEKKTAALFGVCCELAGVLAAHTPLPVFGVPMMGWALNGLDALLATVMMPKGVPVASLAIGKAGAINAGLMVDMSITIAPCGAL